MLLQALAFCTAVALVAGTMLDAALVFAGASLRRAADADVAREFVRARARLRDDVAVRVARAGTGAATVAGFTDPPVPACANPIGCPLTVTDAATVTGATPLAATPANASAENVEEAGFVREVRFSAAVTVVVSARDGTVLARGAQFVTVRALDAPPYAVVTGIADAAAVGSAAAEGDTAGCDPASPAPCVPPAPAGPVDDTRVHAEVCSGAAPDPCAAGKSASADSFATVRWRNGNVNDSGWSR